MNQKNLNIKITTTADSSKATNLAKELDKLVNKSEVAQQELRKLGISGENAGKEISQGSENAQRNILEIGEKARLSNNFLNQMGDVGKLSENEISEGAVKTGLSIRENIGNSIDAIKQKFKGMAGSFSAETGVIKQQMKGMGTTSRLIMGSFENFGGMVLFNVVDGFIQMSKATMNAQSQLDYFGNRLNLSAKESANFRKQLDDLQKDFRKVNMSQVGASAEELALKMNLPKNKLADLTKMTAVLSSTFVKEGRTQEDSILAVGDALDGQFKRLQEIGITQEKLKENGWNGNLEDQANLIDALNKTMESMGYEQTAKDITNLDDAMTALQVTGGNLIASILIPMTPYLVSIIQAFINCSESVKGFVSAFGNLFNFDTSESPAITTAKNISSAYQSLNPAITTAKNFTKAVSEVNNTPLVLPDWAQIILLGGAIGLLAGIMKIKLIPSLIESTIATINWIATSLGAEVSAFTLSGAFSLLGTTIWTALSPLLPFIIAFGLIALAVYEVGKAFGWWNDIGSMLESIQAGVTRLWNAFINNPNVQATINDIKNALNELGSFLGWIGGMIGDAWLSLFPDNPNFDIVRAIIDIFGALGDACGKVVNSLKTVSGAFDVFTQIAGFLNAPVGMILSILKPIICILLGCSPGIVPALEKVQEMFNSVWSNISGFIGGFINNIVSTISLLWDSLMNGQFALNIVNFIFSELMNILITLGGFLPSQLQPAFENVIAIISNIWAAVTNLINIFSAFINGQISIQQLLIGIWNIVSAMFSNVFNNIISFAINWFNGLNQIFNNVVSKVSSFVSSFASKMYSGAVNSVNNFTSQIRSLPGKLQSELNQMVSAVNTWASTLPQKFWNAGVNAVKNFLSALGIASPGTMQRSLVWEITEMGNRVPKESKNLVKNIGELGSEIVDEFNPQLEIGNGVLLSEDNNEYGKGNNFEINITVGSVDNEERVNEIVGAVTKALTWSNITAGRSI